jgi:galactonate dehydratase
MYRATLNIGRRGVVLHAMSAVDIALWDLFGKQLGVPVYELLGGKHRDYVPTFATGNGDSTEEMVDIARRIIDGGFNCMRIHRNLPGERGDFIFEPREHMAMAAEGLAAVRQAIGVAPVLGTDTHHRYSVAETASFLQMMPRHTLDFIEEPIRDETPEAYEVLRTMTDVPFAIGEEFASKWQFLPYIERGITNYARVDICNVGGFTEAMKVAGWAEAHYIDLMPHNPLGAICVAATAHLATAVPNFSWLEIRESPGEDLNFYSKEIYPVQPEITGGRVTLLDRPGLGVEVDEASLNEPFRHSARNFLRRRDGSITNS